MDSLVVEEAEEEAGAVLMDVAPVVEVIVDLVDVS